jgi:hypothetical protein
MTPQAFDEKMFSHELFLLLFYDAGRAEGCKTAGPARHLSQEPSGRTKPKETRAFPVILVHTMNRLSFVLQALGL